MEGQGKPDKHLKKKLDRHWIKVIRSIHRSRLVNDGTEEPPERNALKDIFETKECKQCGKDIKYPEIFYCLECKQLRKYNKGKRRIKNADEQTPPICETDRGGEGSLRPVLPGDGDELLYNPESDGKGLSEEDRDGGTET